MIKSELEQIKKELKVIVTDSIKELPTRKEVKEMIRGEIKELPTRKEVKEIVNHAVDNLALMVAKGFAENTQQHQENTREHQILNSRLTNVQSELYDVHAKVDGLSNQAIRDGSNIRHFER